VHFVFQEKSKVFFSLAILYPLERPPDLFNTGLICFDKWLATFDREKYVTWEWNNGEKCVKWEYPVKICILLSKHWIVEILIYQTASDSFGSENCLKNCMKDLKKKYGGIGFECFAWGQARN